MPGPGLGSYTPPSGTPLPAGFTPQSISDYYKSLIAPIDQQTEANVGSAQTSAVARGLGGTPAESGGMAAAQYYGDLGKSQTMGNLAFNMAGLANQSSLIKGQQDWQAGQNALNRQYGLTEQQIGQGWQSGMANTMNRYGYQSGIANLGAAIGGGALFGAFA